ncbi:hypothetical protein KIL84_000293 [Mauremys mutica]|uniref:Uncharacterized protein n=1 Tax=Mauremys mutica TaxID=74926 RepID=A0A9D4AWH4_9SAUR|nr:hypothetical protein KIL84_000293 [Mauremys mutica]
MESLSVPVRISLGLSPLPVGSLRPRRGGRRMRPACQRALTPAHTGGGDREDPPIPEWGSAPPRRRPAPCRTRPLWARGAAQQPPRQRASLRGGYVRSGAGGGSRLLSTDPPARTGTLPLPRAPSSEGAAAPLGRRPRPASARGGDPLP